jgi:hypothetical protein
MQKSWHACPKVFKGALANKMVGKYKSQVFLPNPTHLPFFLLNFYESDIIRFYFFLGNKSMTKTMGENTIATLLWNLESKEMTNN